MAGAAVLPCPADNPGEAILARMLGKLNVHHTLHVRREFQTLAGTRQSQAGTKSEKERRGCAMVSARKAENFGFSCKNPEAGDVYNSDGCDHDLLEIRINFMKRSCCNCITSQKFVRCDAKSCFRGGGLTQ